MSEIVKMRDVRFDPGGKCEAEPMDWNCRHQGLAR